MKKHTKSEKKEKQKEILPENRDKESIHTIKENETPEKSESQEYRDEEQKRKIQGHKSEEGIIREEVEKEACELRDVEAKSTQGEVPGDKGTKEKKKKNHLWVIAAAFILSVLIFVYLGGAYYYGKHFFPSKKINGLECGNLTADETVKQLQDWYSINYSLSILGRDGEEVLTVTAPDAQMVFPLEQEVGRILAEQNAFTWICSFFAQTTEEKQAAFTVEYDSDAIEAILEESGLFDSKSGEKPQDAYISEYLEEIRRYEIIPEKAGTLLDEGWTFACVCEALEEMEASLNLEEAGCYQQPEITSDNEELQAKLEQMNKMVGSHITYDWNGTEEVVDGGLIHNWMIVEGMEVTLDEELIAAYVEEKSKEYDTYGKKRDFVTTLGIEVRLPSGAYGWKTDREAETAALIELISEGSVTTKEPEYISRGWVKGANDIGNSYVEIDLTNQHLYLYKDGELILETDFVSGDMAKGNATPQGVFGLTYKTTNAVLRGRDYETPVNYWMPFNGNVGMHDATWRRNFGGEIYLTNGSHGCVNLPLGMAASIYSQISTGFPVICYYY